MSRMKLLSDLGSEAVARDDGNIPPDAPPPRLKRLRDLLRAFLIGPCVAKEDVSHRSVTNHRQPIR